MESSDATGPTRRAAAFSWGRFWIVAIAVIVTHAGVQSYRSSDLPGAFTVYLRAAHRIVEGQQIYRTDEEAFTYPPFFALPFVPLAMLPPRAALLTWHLVNGVLIAGTVAALAVAIRPLVPPRHRRALAPWVIITALLTARGLVAPLERASHDGIVLALLAAALIAAIRTRMIIAGGLLGLAAACKATPLLFLPVLLVRGQWKAAAALVLSCLLASALPDVLYPAASGRPWVQQWFSTFVAPVQVSEAANVQGAWRTWNHHNQNLAGTLHRLTAEPDRSAVPVPGLPLLRLGEEVRGAVTLAGVGLLLMLTLAASWRAHPAPVAASRPARVWELFAIWGLVGSAMLLLSPMTSKQHFGLMAFSLILACLAVVHYRSRAAPLLIAGLAVVFVLSTCAARDLVGHRLAYILLSYGSLSWCALACWVMSLVLLWRAPEAVSATVSTAESSGTDS